CGVSCCRVAVPVFLLQFQVILECLCVVAVGVVEALFPFLCVLVNYPLEAMRTLVFPQFLVVLIVYNCLELVRWKERQLFICACCRECNHENYKKSYSNSQVEA
ncbi:hypothetical protein EJB05_46254, partial [Eragrostis curvula]